MKCSFSTWIVARSFSLSLFLSPSPSYPHSNTRSFWHGVAKAFSFLHIIIVSVKFPIFGGFFGILISYRSSFAAFILNRTFCVASSNTIIVILILFVFHICSIWFSCTHNNNRCHTSFFSMSRLLPVLFLIINDCEFSARCWLSQRPRS